MTSFFDTESGQEVLSAARARIEEIRHRQPDEVFVVPEVTVEEMLRSAVRWGPELWMPESEDS